MPPPKRRGNTCVAWKTDATPRTSTPQRRGDTCVARKTVATPQLAGITAYTAANNAANKSCRSGTGRHKWRPYVHHRAPAVATPQLAGNIAYTAARNAADGSCRSGTGRHKWRPYVHHRPNNRRNAAGCRRQNVGATLVSPGKPSQRHNWPASPRAGPRQMRQRARSKLLVTTDTDEKAMHAADTPGVSISPHTGKSAPAARGMPTAL